MIISVISDNGDLAEIWWSNNENNGSTHTCCMFFMKQSLQRAWCPHGETFLSFDLFYSFRIFRILYQKLYFHHFCDCFWINFWKTWFSWNMKFAHFKIYVKLLSNTFHKNSPKRSEWFVFAFSLSVDSDKVTCITARHSPHPRHWGEKMKVKTWQTIPIHLLPQHMLLLQEWHIYKWEDNDIFWHMLSITMLFLQCTSRDKWWHRQLPKRYISCCEIFSSFSYILAKNGQGKKTKGQFVSKIKLHNL